MRLEGGLLKLAEKLGIEAVTNKQLLLNLILPNLDALAPEVRFTAFEWVASHWNEVEPQDDLLTALASARFVPAGPPSDLTFPPSHSSIPFWAKSLHTNRFQCTAMAVLPLSTQSRSRQASPRNSTFGN